MDLPIDDPCVIDEPPSDGEATVLVGERLYGLGPDGMSPRCLLDGVNSSDIEWGPQGDRVRIGKTFLTATTAMSEAGAVDLGWTAPTGSRVLVVKPGEVTKVDLETGDSSDITFLTDNDAATYHPAGEHILFIGTDTNAQYGLWLTTNQGTDPLLLAFDEGASMAEPSWTWLGEPMFVAKHFDGAWHIHRVDLTAEGGLDGPVIVDSDEPLDTLMPSQFDPVMVAYRTGGDGSHACVDGGRAAVNGTDFPEPLLSMTSVPVGWLSGERLLVMAYPDGCESPGELWTFSAGFCPGSVYGAERLIVGIDGAAARQAAPEPPPPPDFTGIIDPAPA